MARAIGATKQGRREEGGGVIAFKDREADRQGDFRDQSPTISRVGRTPADAAGKRHRHLLALRHEAENLIPFARGPGGVEDFFHARGIKWWKAETGGESRNPGPTRNLLSSQVLCVNFLFPLVENPEALTALLQAIDDDVVGVEPIVYEGLTTTPSAVEFEWVGERRPLEEDKRATRGALVTSVDALLAARLKNGGLRAYLMEWKYTESYPPKRDEGKDATRRTRYYGRYRSPTSPFREGVPFIDWLYDPFYQIMRLLLLGQRMVDERELHVTEAVVVVVCPAANVEYRERITSPGLSQFGATVDGVVRGLLKNPKAFRMTTPAILMKSVGDRHDTDLEDWVAYHRQRYGW